MSIEEIALEAEERMEKSVTLLTDQMRGIRTGRANVGLVESIRVDYYGSSTPLKQMANLSTPEPQQILIRPFDHTVIGDIVKAIQTSDLGLSPNSDGKVDPPERPPLVGRTAQEAGQSRQGARRRGPRGDPQHPPRRQQTGRSRANREDPHRRRRQDLQGRGPRPHQEVRGQGQRDWPTRSRPRSWRSDKSPA